MARGDHIYIHCLGYSHHAIDLGDGRVIHFDYQPWQSLSRRRQAEDPPAIRETTLHAFADGRPVVTRKYTQCDDADTVVARALSRVGQSGYSLFSNNCEHFAIWCKTGESQSTQVRDFLAAVRPVSQALPAAALLVRHGRRLPVKLRAVAYGTALALTAGAFAQRYLGNRIRRAFDRES